MTEFKNKNIDDSLSRFYSSEQAEQIKKDFTYVNAMFEKFPAPNPSRQTTAEIKQKIVRHLETRKRTNWISVFAKTASVAAIVVIFSAVLFPNHSAKDLTQPASRRGLAWLIPQGRTEGGYAQNEHQTSLRQTEQAGLGTDLSFLEAELKQLETELLTINLGEDNSTNGILADQVENLELEIIETENTFWKG